MGQELAPFKKKEAGKLTQQQEDALELVLLGWQTEEIAGRVGVCRHTIMRWMNEDADFITELRERREQIWAEHRLQLFNLIHRALNVFESLLICGDSRLQLKAALGLLKLPAVQRYLAAEKFGGDKQDFILMALERTLIKRQAKQDGRAVDTPKLNE